MIIEFNDLPEQIRSFYNNSDKLISRVYERHGIYGPFYALARKTMLLDIWEQEKGCPPVWTLRQLAGSILNRR